MHVFTNVLLYCLPVLENSGLIRPFKAYIFLPGFSMSGINYLCLILLFTLIILINKYLLYLDIRLVRLTKICLCALWMGVSLFGCASLEDVDQVRAPKQPLPSDCGSPDCSPLTAIRLPKKPGIGPQGLPIPSFSSPTGPMAFGDKVRLTVTGLPTGAVMEYSYDKGKTWVVGNQVPVITKDTVLGRTRINDLTSSPAKAIFTYYFQRMMVVGNSIMSHAPAPEIGWTNFNGMAASAPEKDYAHLLTSRLEAIHSPIALRLQSGGTFEREFGKASYSLDEFNEALQTFKPDLIIVRIGENVDEGEVLGGRNFELQFRRLLERLASGSQPAKIICTTSVWNRPKTDAIIRKVTTEKGYPLVDLSSMVGQDQYLATQYKNPGVSAHPNDAGMQRITDLIWQQVP